MFENQKLQMKIAKKKTINLIKAKTDQVKASIEEKVATKREALEAELAALNEN